MPKITRTRFLGIRDNHNHYTSLRLLFYRPIDVDLSKACYTWSVLDLHVLPCFSTDLLMSTYPRHASILTCGRNLPCQSFMIPMLLKEASVGMYSGCDYLLSLKILFVYFLALPSLLHHSILFNCFYTCFSSFLLHECNYIILLYMNP